MDAITAQRRVNRYFGGKTALLAGIAPLFDAWPRTRRFLRICDIGSGSGELPIAIAEEARRRRIRCHILAVEFDTETAAVAREETRKNREITVIEADARDVLSAAARGAGFRRHSGAAIPHASHLALARARPFHVVTASSFLGLHPPAEIVAWFGLIDAASTLGWAATEVDGSLVATAGMRLAGWETIGGKYRFEDWRKFAMQTEANATRHRPSHVIVARRKKNRLPVA